MDLAPTTYTAPSSLKLSPVAPIYDAWRDIAADFLRLGETIRSCPLDLVAASLGVPVWRTAWPEGVKAQVIAWYGQYGGHLYTRAGLAAFVWIFGGDLTTWGAITDYWETAALEIEVYNSDGDSAADELLEDATWTATYASGDTVKLSVYTGMEGQYRLVSDGVYGFTLTLVALHGGPIASSDFVSLTPDAPAYPTSYDGMPVPVILDIISYADYDPAWAPRTTAATPTTPMAYADDVILSYIAEWEPLGYTLTLDSSAAVIAANPAIRRIIVTIPSGNLATVPLGAAVGVWSSVSGYSYDFRLVSLEPTDDPTIFTGIIVSVHQFDGTNDPAQQVTLQDATAVMDTSIPDGILQRSYPAVATGDPVLTTGRAGWDAVDVSTHAELLIEVYNNDGDNLLREFDPGAVWTATYASGDKVKFAVNPGEDGVILRWVGGSVYGFTFPVMTLHGGPLPSDGWVSFTPDDTRDPEFYDDVPTPIILDIISYGADYYRPAIPAIPALGTIIPMPPLATAAPIPQTDAEYYKSAVQSVPNVAGAQVYITGNAVTIRPLMLPDYRVGDANTITAVERYFNVFGFALGSHVITCKNLNAKDTVLTFDVVLNGVTQADFTTAANDIARAFLTDLGAQVCDAEGGGVYLGVEALRGAIKAATDADVSGVTGNVRFPAASVAVVYTATGYTYAPNGLKADNGVGITLTFNFEA